MIRPLFYYFVWICFAILYPGYETVKATMKKRSRHYPKWLKYWSVLAFFSAFETFSDLFLAFWFPFYYELKIFLVVFLIYPVTASTLGSGLLFKLFVEPLVKTYQKDIDRQLLRFRKRCGQLVCLLVASLWRLIIHRVLGPPAAAVAPAVPAQVFSDDEDG